MHLAAMVGLVLENMAQKVIAAVVLGTVTPVNADDGSQGLGGQGFDMGEETQVRRLLPADQGGKVGAGAGFVKGGFVQRRAFEGVQVKAVNQKDVVQRGLNRAEESGARGGQFGGIERCAGAVQPGIGEQVGLGKFAKDAKGVSHRTPLQRGKGERLDNDPSGARYGCFLPDLTGLARCLPAPTSRRVI
jgi:hypothetical protein